MAFNSARQKAGNMTILRRLWIHSLLAPLLTMTVVMSSANADEWKAHEVRQLAEQADGVAMPAKLQIVTENWNRVVAVPYIVYMPEKDRLLMLVSCDYPHRPMVLTSDDHGASWSQPQPVLPDEPAHARHLLGVSLTYLGDGHVLCGIEGKLRCRSIDYGQTWTSEPIPPNSHSGGWNQWDPYLVDRDAATGKVIQLMETGYRGSTDGGQEAFLRSSLDLGKSWNDATRVPQWAKVSEVALARAANGHIVAACRTDIPPSKQGETLDHFEGLGVSISADEGRTWSEVQKLFDWGRHHPSLVVMPTGEIVMTYVVRKGYIDTEDGFPQFGIAAVVSRDHGQTWDLDHRYLLHTWVGNRKGSNQNAPGPQAWWASSQATSTVLLPDGNLLTAFGTGYRSQPNAQGMSSPRDVGLIQWQLSKEPAWEMTKTLSLEGLEISLSKPRLVARSDDYLWFPTMTRLSGGELCANFSTNLDAIVADRTSSVSWSADDGLTWSEPSSIMPKGDLYAETMLRLKNGDEMLLPFNHYPDGEAMRGWHQIVSGKKGERKVTFTDKSITVSGWPRPDRSFNEKLGLSGFGFNGHGIMGKSGEYLATMYGYFKDEHRYSLVMVESTDGLAWKFRSLIAGFDCPLAGGEGPCESQSIRLKDGRLMNVFRLASNVPYGQAFSDDDGRTWSAPVAMQDAHSVQPSLAMMRDGSIVLTGGRPGIFAWINRAGDGKDWLQVDLQSHHNENHALDAITRADQTTSYTEVVALDEQSVIVIYDHIPHGWNAIPNDSQDTNSIWVVKLAWKAN